jgi:hypothetical protein
VVEPLEDQHLRAAEERGIEGKAGIFGRGAHQRDRPAFDKREEAVLLRAIEAVDLVHEEQRALPGLRKFIRFSEGFLEVRDA